MCMIYAVECKYFFLEKTEGAMKNEQSRENRKGNQKWTIQRKRQNRAHKTKTNKTKLQHNMCWTPNR